MALDVGDAVLTFLGDTTQLDQAFARVVDSADKSMSTAADSVDQVGDSLKKLSFELDATGSNASYAGGEIKDAMEKASASLVDLGTGFSTVRSGFTGFDLIPEVLKKVGDGAGEAGQKMHYSFREARGGLMLLTEEVGIHLPRELTMLLAHIPMVGLAFEAMLPVLGVIAAIKVIGDLIEKHEKLAEAERHAGEISESLQIKQNDLALGLAAANLQLEDQIRKLEGRPAVNTLSLALIAVKRSVDDLATTYAADFQKMDKNIEDQLGVWANLKRAAMDVVLVLDEMGSSDTRDVGEASRRVQGNKEEVASLNALIATQQKLDQARRKLADEDPSKNMEAWKAAAGAVAIAAGNVQAAADAAHAAVLKVNPDAKELLGTLTDKAATAKGEWRSMASEIARVGIEARKANQELANDSAEKQALAAKNALDKQLEAIRSTTSAKHSAFEDDKISRGEWLASEVQATHAAAIANEDYLSKLVSIYTRAGDVLKAHEAKEKLELQQEKDAREASDALNNALDKRRATMSKLGQEYGRLLDANVTKSWDAAAKAANTLAGQELKLVQAQEKLKASTITEHFGEQEKAIEQLANFRLISEEQKAHQLELLYHREEEALLNALNETLKKEQETIAAAQAKMTAAKSNPFVTPEQIAELEKLLHEAQQAEATTGQQIHNTRKQFQDKQLSLDKGYYGRALALAVAYGRDLLAEQLKENHASLLAAQAKLAEAKARGVNTTALQHEIAALKQNEQQLQKQANGNKQAIAAELQLTKAQLLATQAILADAKARGLDTAAIEKHIQALKAEVAELQKTKQATNNLAVATDKLKQDTKAAAGEMLQSLSTAFEGIITGQQSFGKAMEDATFKMLGKMAMSWGEYFAAKGIADIWEDPPLGGAELAASAALFAMSGVMSGLASGSGSSSHSSVNNVSSSNNPTGVSQSSSSGGGSTQTVSVTKLAAGGIVSRPTMFMAGDSASGGSAAEAIIPLTDPAALARISNALLSGPTLRSAAAGMTSTANLAAASGASPTARFDDATITKLGERIGQHLDSSGTQGDRTNVHVHVKGSVDHGTIAGLVQKINRKVGNRQLTLNATNSQRLTRRSQ